MATYTLNTAFKSNDQQDMVLIKLGNPLIVDMKQILKSAGPGATTQTLQATVEKNLLQKTKQSRRAHGQILTIATGMDEYASGV